MPVPAPLQIEVMPHPLGLRVHVRGEETFANTVACWRSIHDHLGAATGAGLLVVDELQGEPLSEAHWLELVLMMADTGLKRFRIAHVKPRGMHEIEFCELYARDAGYDARVFTSEHAAERWLRSG